MASPTGIVKSTPFLPSNKKHAGKNAVKQAVAEKFYGKAVANNAQETVNTNTEEIHAVAKAAAKATMPVGWVGSIAAEATKRGKKRAGVDSSAEEGVIAPQRARSALDIYVEEERVQVEAADPEDAKALTKAALRKVCGDKWKQMSAADKKPFQERASADKVRYEEEMTAWNDRNQSSKPRTAGSSKAHEAAQAIAAGADTDKEMSAADASEPAATSTEVAAAAPAAGGAAKGKAKAKRGKAAAVEDMEEAAEDVPAAAKENVSKGEEAVAAVAEAVIEAVAATAAGGDKAGAAGKKEKKGKAAARGKGVKRVAEEEHDDSEVEEEELRQPMLP